MKKIFLSLSLVLLALYSYSQFSYPINYQAVVRDAAGNLAANGSTVSFRFTIREASETGPARYAETHSAIVNNNQGLINLAIGNGTPTLGTELWSVGFDEMIPKFLTVEVDPTGGTSYVNLGTTQMRGVPYANHAYTSIVARNGYHKAFQHTTTASNTSGHITTLTYDDQHFDDLVVVTHCYTSVHLPRVPYSVYWNGTTWCIYLDRAAGTELMPIDTKFNVIVIKTM